MRESKSFTIFRIVVIAFLSLTILLPLYVMLSSAVKPLADVTNTFDWIPSKITFEPLKDMWTTVPLAHYFMNSFIVSLVASLLSASIAIFAGYAVSRWRFKGRKLFTTSILATQMFPGILFLLPLFIIFAWLNNAFHINLLSSLLGLILTYLTFTLPFSIWMLSGYFDGIPTELDEAAKVDGCNALSALFRVLLPAARPGIVAVCIYCFMTAWGELLFASQLTTATTATLPIGLQQYSSQVGTYWNQIMGASIVVSVPIVVIFLLLQRSFVAGLTQGSVK